ncbi:hypothetical protein P167DRAFT_525367, partial [Morchella conica CCBAS932]
VIKHLKDRVDASDCGVAYIYFDYKGRGNQTPILVLASLVKQLGYQIPHLPQKISKLYEDLEHKGERPSLEELLVVLLSIFASFKRAFIIFDALDECNQKGQRDRLLPYFIVWGRVVPIYLSQVDIILKTYRCHSKTYQE